MAHKRPTPQHLPAKLRAIRNNAGLSQYRLSKLLQVGRTRLSEWGRRMPEWKVLIRHAEFAGIPLEFIVGDEIDLDYCKHYLTVVNQRRGEITLPVTLFWPK